MKKIEEKNLRNYLELLFLSSCITLNEKNDGNKFY